MKLLYVQFLQLLLILKASFMATSFPTKTDLPLHCLDGPNFDPDLQYPTSVQDTACRSSQSFCLRIEAGLAPLRENNATGIFSNLEFFKSHIHFLFLVFSDYIF